MQFEDFNNSDHAIESVTLNGVKSAVGPIIVATFSTHASKKLFSAVATDINLPENVWRNHTCSKVAHTHTAVSTAPRFFFVRNMSTLYLEEVS